MVESDDRLIPIEIKAASRPRLSDADHIRAFQKEYGEKSRMGLLLHTGNETKQLTSTVIAAPWWKVA